MLVNPNSEFLREPNLLIPGKKPVCPVKITQPAILGNDFAFYLCNDLQLTDGNPEAGHLSDSLSSVNMSIRINPRGNKDIFISGHSSPVLITSSARMPWWQKAKPHFSYFSIVEFQGDSGTLTSIGGPSGGISIEHKTIGKDLDIKINNTGTTVTETSDGNGGGANWASNGDSLRVGVVFNEPNYFIQALNASTGVYWEASGSVSGAFNSVTADTNLIYYAGDNIGYEMILVSYSSWSPGFLRSLINDPYQFLVPA